MAGKKTFVAGEVLTAQDVNDYLMDQSVMNFATVAARSSAIPTPTTGMVSYVGDTGSETPTSTIPQIQAYTGAAWQNIDGMTLLASAPMSAVSSIQFNNVFSADYISYLMSVNITTTTASIDFQFKLSSGGTVSSASYTTVGYVSGVSGDTGSTSNLGTGRQNKAQATVATAANGGQGGFNTILHQPFLASRTAILSDGTITDSGSGLTSYLSRATHFLSSSYDGFQLIASSGTMTGTVKVYGLRNS
jgi:hypothetical protein